MSDLSAEDRARLERLAGEIQGNPYERERWAEDASEDEALLIAESLELALALIDQQAAKIESYDKALGEAIRDLDQQGES